MKDKEIKLEILKVAERLHADNNMINIDFYTLVNHLHKFVFSDFQPQPIMPGNKGG